MSNATPSIQLVVFDWAGTMIDFGSRAPAAAFKQVFEGQGVMVTDEEARGPMGLNKREHLTQMLEMPAVAQRWHAAKGRDWTEADIDTMYQEFMPHQLKAIKLNSEIIPGMLQVSKELNNRSIKTGGTTGYFIEAAELVLAAANQAGVSLDTNVCADDVPQGRPAPWMIYEVMKRVGVFPPSHVVKIGDTSADIAAGVNAACWTIGVCDSSSMTGLSLDELSALSAEEREARLAKTRAAFEKAGSHYTITSLEELPRVIDQINERLAQGERP